MGKLQYLAKQAYGREAFYPLDQSQWPSGTGSASIKDQRAAAKTRADAFAKRMRMASNSMLSIIGVTQRRHTAPKDNNSVSKALGNFAMPKAAETAPNCSSVYHRLLVFGGIDNQNFAQHLVQDYRQLGAARFFFVGEFSQLSGYYWAAYSDNILAKINYAVRRVVWARISSRRWRGRVISLTTAIAWLGVTSVYYMIRHNTLLQELSLVPDGSIWKSLGIAIPFHSELSIFSRLVQNVPIMCEIALLDQICLSIQILLMSVLVPSLTTIKHVWKSPVGKFMSPFWDMIFAPILAVRHLTGHFGEQDPANHHQRDLDVIIDASSHAQIEHGHGEREQSGNGTTIHGGINGQMSNDNQTRSTEEESYPKHVVLSSQWSVMVQTSRVLSQIITLPLNALLLRHISQQWLNANGRTTIGRNVMPLHLLPWQDRQRPFVWLSKVGICLVSNFVLGSLWFQPD